MTESSKVLTTFQAAEYCQVSPFTIRNWVESGKLPAYRTPGGHRRIRKGDLDEFLKKHDMPGGGQEAEDKRRILVVDDDEIVADFVSKIARDIEGGADVPVALDGFEAGTMVTSIRPQVVILDLRMPGLDGFEVCRKIKASSATSSTVVIGITGYYSAEYAKKFADCGGHHLLRKPIDVQELKQAISEAFEIYKEAHAERRP
jgi:excisionase family DNA binding protein